MSERDRYKPKTPPAGVAAQLATPETWPDEECTGKYEGDELEEIRAKRPTKERLRRVEKKQDKLGVDVGELKATVARIDGKLEVVPRLVNLLEKVVGAELAGDNAKLTAHLEIGKAQAADQLEANRLRRALIKDWATKALAAVGALGLVVLGVLQAQAQGCGH
jgi:hypothetical protein